MSAAGEKTVLELSELVVELSTEKGPVRPVDRVSFTLQASETLGLVGESGSGKSMTARAILGLLPDRIGRYAGGRLSLFGQSMIDAPPARWRELRGAQVGMVFQEPMTALNPVYTVGAQIMEVMEAHGRYTKKERRARAIAMLQQVGIPAPEQRVDDYPHQLSGGMRQRVMIAIALVLDPKILIADEPTTALDVTVQAQILDLIAQLAKERGTATLLITHDLAIVAERCQRVAVMYAGQIVELGPTRQVLDDPRHHYTRGLLDALPGAGRLPKSIPGMVAPLSALPAGCRFAPRCARAEGDCLSRPPELEASGGRALRCYFPVTKAGGP